MEIPTARIMKENTYRAGATQVSPYRYYYLWLSPFKGLEVGGKITEIIGVAGFNNGGNYGDYKDKATDLKYRLLEEGKYTPAIALAINDFQGNRLYASQSVVASKQIYPFDFTVGLGNGRFGKRPLPTSNDTSFQAEIFTSPRSWLSDSQLFWGIQFAPSEKYSFMVEYSPIRYEKQTQDPAQAKYFQSPVSSPFNFGFRWKPFTWGEIDITYQRGNEIGISLSTVFNIGKPLVPIYDAPYKEKKEYLLDSVENRLVKALRASGFSNIGITLEKDSLRIEAENGKYYYAPRAVGVILRLVIMITPARIQKIDIVLTRYRIPMIEFSTLREDIAEWYGEKLTQSEFIFLSKMNSDLYKTPDVEIKNRRYVDYGVKPAFETLVNDPNHFFMYRLGLEGWANLHPWEGLSLVAAVSGYALNDIKSSNPPLADAVRSDIFAYKEKNLNLTRLMAEQIFKGDHQIYSKLAAGLLEVEYAGLDGEIAMPLLNGRVLVGLGGSAVRKRDPDDVLKLSADYTKVYNTQFFNTRLNVPELNMWLDVKTGRFLAGDYGSVVTLSKNINGVTLYAWYSFTNTNVMTDPQNRSYNDKGIGVSIPIRLFEGTDSRTTYTYAVSPWTRDVAQDIEHFNGLFDFIGRNLKVFWDKDEKEMK